jgi:hypothetical protein
VLRSPSLNRETAIISSWVGPPASVVPDIFSILVVVMYQCL